MKITLLKLDKNFANKKIYYATKKNNHNLNNAHH